MLTRRLFSANPIVLTYTLDSKVTKTLLSKDSGLKMLMLLMMSILSLFPIPPILIHYQSLILSKDLILKTMISNRKKKSHKSQNLVW
jgi:hypothetical protein